MKTSKSQFLLWLGLFLIYVIIVSGFSSHWFQRQVDTETYFVWWLIGVFFFISVLRMGINYIQTKANKNHDVGS